MNYYNEFDPKIAAWLRQLIADGHIPQGEVDERSIEDVTPGDLRGFLQCHFFAGIGGWSHALDLAGWPRNQRVWTGSCPCQPFSAAGKGDGFADERHLWPAWQHLIAQCRPAVVFGEQVASKAAEPWIDLVQADLENLGYAFGCIPFPSASVGAPHIRDRNFWMGHAIGARLEGHGRHGHDSHESGWIGTQPRGSIAETGAALRLADAEGDGHERRGEFDEQTGRHSPAHSIGTCGLGNADSESSEWGTGSISRAETPEYRARLIDGSQHHGLADAGEGMGERPGPLHGFWADADWLLCRDGKWRPVRSGSFPLADGLPARMVRLRGYGNAINPHQAAHFIKASVEAIADQESADRLGAAA